MRRGRNVSLSPGAGRALQRMAARRLPPLKEAFRELAASPFSGKKLRGPFAGLYCYRTGGCRMVYRINRGQIEVGYVDYREDLYR